MQAIINHLSSSQLVDAISFTLLHSFWQGLLIGVIAYLTLRKNQGKSSHFKYLISLASLLLIFIVACFTFSFYYFQGIPTIASSTGIVEVSRSATAAVLTPISETQSALKNIFLDNANRITWTWLIGVSLFSLRLIGGGLYLSGIKRSVNFHLPIKLKTAIKQVSTHLPIDRKVSFGVTDKVSIPMIIGHFKPIVIFPVAALNQLTVQEVETILAHEIAHITRKDFIQNMVIVWIETLFFYHPVIWWLSSVIRSERENSCDDLTVKHYPDRIQYAQTLVRLQEIAHQPTPQLAMTLFHHKKSLMKRINRILKQQHSSSMVKEKLLATVFILAAVMCFGSAHDFINTGNWKTLAKISPLDFKGIELDKVKYFPTIMKTRSSFDGTGHFASQIDVQPVANQLLENSSAIDLYTIPLMPEDPVTFRIDLPNLGELSSGPFYVSVIQQDTVPDKKYERQREIVREKAQELREKSREMSRKIRESMKQFREENRAEMDELRDKLRSERKTLSEMRREMSDEQKERYRELRDKMKVKAKELKKLKKEYKKDGDWEGSAEEWEDFSRDLAEYIEESIDLEWLDEISDMSFSFNNDFISEMDFDWVDDIAAMGEDMAFSFDFDFSQDMADLGIEISTSVTDMIEGLDIDAIVEDALESSELVLYDFKQTLVESLNEDGLLKSKGLNTFEIKGSNVSVNGTQLSQEMSDKYRGIVSELLDDPLDDNIELTFKIEGNDLDNTSESSLSINNNND